MDDNAIQELKVLEKKMNENLNKIKENGEKLKIYDKLLDIIYRK